MKGSLPYLVGIITGSLPHSDEPGYTGVTEKEHIQNCHSDQQYVHYLQHGLVDFQLAGEHQHFSDQKTVDHKNARNPGNS